MESWRIFSWTICGPDICENPAMDSTILLKVASVNKLEETIVKNLASEDMDRPIFTGLNNSLNNIPHNGLQNNQHNRLHNSLNNNQHNSSHNSPHNSLHNILIHLFFV